MQHSLSHMVVKSQPQSSADKTFHPIEKPLVHTQWSPPPDPRGDEPAAFTHWTREVQVNGGGKQPDIDIDIKISTDYEDILRFVSVGNC